MSLNFQVPQLRSCSAATLSTLRHLGPNSFLLPCPCVPGSIRKSEANLNHACREHDHCDPRRRVAPQPVSKVKGKKSIQGFQYLNVRHTQGNIQKEASSMDELVLDFRPYTRGGVKTVWFGKAACANVEEATHRRSGL